MSCGAMANAVHDLMLSLGFSLLPHPDSDFAARIAAGILNDDDRANK